MGTGPLTPGEPVAYLASFDCLWCGTAWTTRGPDDLEGWAKLCPTCLGMAGANPFLRGRLRQGLEARAANPAAAVVAPSAVATPPATHSARPHAPYPAFPDDWFLRRGAFERGAIHDAAWAAELDMLTRWLDGLPLRGRIVEPAAGVGFFSPLLADKGELFALDADGDALDRARDRLLAHRLRAHLHVGDPFAPRPEQGGDEAGAPRDADAVVAAFLLGRVRGAGLDLAAASLRERVRPGGLLALIDLRPDAAGGPPPGVAWTWHDPSLVEAALVRAGFGGLVLGGTGRFFLTASAVAR